MNDNGCVVVNESCGIKTWDFIKNELEILNAKMNNQLIDIIQQETKIKKLESLLAKGNGWANVVEG